MTLSARLAARKDGRRIAVVLPALDEEATVGALVAGLTRLCEGPVPLVDDLVVLDSGSTDRTAEYAAAAGARVLGRERAVPGVHVLPGKGEAMWRAVVALGNGPRPADLVCFIDADLVEPLAAPFDGQPDVIEGDFHELAHRMGLAGGQHIIAGLVLPQHQPHALDIIPRVAPVALGVDIAEE